MMSDMNPVDADPFSPKGTKYFLTRMNGWTALLAIGLPLIAYTLLIFNNVPEERALPVFSACVGAGIAIGMARPWLRRAVSFWIALGASCAVQFGVIHWITLYEGPNAKGYGYLRGVGLLSALLGYAVGVPLFLLMQRITLNEKRRGSSTMP